MDFEEAPVEPSSVVSILFKFLFQICTFASKTKGFVNKKVFFIIKKCKFHKKNVKKIDLKAHGVMCWYFDM